jgi:hypothetical protein
MQGFERGGLLGDAPLKHGESVLLREREPVAQNA